MQVVTDRWKELHKETLLPETFLKLTYKVSKSGVNDSYTAESNGVVPWSDISDLSEVSPLCPKYALLELNQWLLDGTRDILPESESDFGNGKYISSAICDKDGYFNERPVLELSWEQAYEGVSIPGITIQWSNAYNEYPIEYVVKVYNGDVLQNELTNSDNDSITNIFLIDIENFNRIEIEVIRWNLPYHRARLEQLYVGVIRTYEKGDLMSYTHEELCDILSGELPVGKIVFSLDNSDGKWNPLNPEGENKYLLEQQTIEVKYGMDVDGSTEWIDGGVFFLSEWNTPSNGIEATFTADNMLTFMDELYTGPRSGTLYDIAIAAVNQVDLPDDATYDFDKDILGAVSVDFSNEDSNEEYKISEILQMVASAGKCIIYQDREGCLRIKPASMVLSDYVIRKFVSYSYPEFTISKELKSVNVNDGLAVVENSAKGAVQTVNNPIVTGQTHARDVGEWVRGILNNRRVVSGEYRADVRMSAGDVVIVENEFSEFGSGVFVTSVKYAFDGAFTGTYEGRVIE